MRGKMGHNIRPTLISAGKKAWTEIKKRGKQDRVDWLKVSEALIALKEEADTDHAYGKLIKKHGFDDIDSRTRTDAIWWAENHEEVSAIIADTLSHPQLIRKEYQAVNEREAEAERQAEEALQKARDQEEREAAEAKRQEDLEASRVDSKAAKRAGKLIRTLEDEASAPREKEMARVQLDKIKEKTGADEGRLKRAAELKENTARFRRRLEEKKAEMAEEQTRTSWEDVAQNYDDMGRDEFLEWLKPYIKLEK